MPIAKRSTPKGREPQLSLKPVAEYLSSVLGAEVPLAPDCVGEPTDGADDGVAGRWTGALAGDLRFYPREEATAKGRARPNVITMDNYEVAKVLDETADMLEVAGENFFRVRATITPLGRSAIKQGKSPF
jgi:3-phosphoglycerate kinase